MPGVSCFHISTDSQPICTVCQLWAIILQRDPTRVVEDYVSLLVIYISCILATTLWCTILIVIRILTVTREANGRLGDYHHIIEVLVESSALHSVTLIIYIALEASQNTASDYFDTLAAITTVPANLLFLEYIISNKNIYRESLRRSSPDVWQQVTLVPTIPGKAASYHRFASNLTRRLMLRHAPKRALWLTLKLSQNR